MSEDRTLPDNETKRAILRDQLDKMQQQHYQAILMQTVLKLQNPGAHEKQKAEYEQQLKQAEVQIANIRVSAQKLADMLDELPAPKNTDPFEEVPEEPA